MAQYNDCYSLPNNRDREAIGMELKSVKENYDIPNIHWGYVDEITYKDGRKEYLEGHNIVVKGVSKLIAALLGAKVSNGIQY